jgi:hypothetical protein
MLNVLEITYNDNNIGGGVFLELSSEELNLCCAMEIRVFSKSSQTLTHIN